MSGFNTKERNNYGEYEITFYTENRQDFKKVLSFGRTENLSARLREVILGLSGVINNVYAKRT